MTSREPHLHTNLGQFDAYLGRSADRFVRLACLFPGLYRVVYRVSHGRGRSLNPVPLLDNDVFDTRRTNRPTA